MKMTVSGATEELVKELEKQFGFDKPVHERLWKMIKDYVRFDFGRSYYQDKSVLELIAERMPVSVSLGLWSTLTFFLVVLSILGPLSFALSVYDGFQGTLTHWLSKYCRGILPV